MTPDRDVKTTGYCVFGEHDESSRGAGNVLWTKSQEGFVEALNYAERGDLLVAHEVDWPAHAVSHAGLPDLRRTPNLLVTRPLNSRLRAIYGSLFDRVVDPGFVKLIRESELLDLLEAPHRDELFLGGVFIRDIQSLLLYRGTLEPLLVPLAWFAARPSSPTPDASRFSIEDYGQTVRLGSYEAAADAILYEYDPEFRKRVKKRLRSEDTSLGGSIRRLRLQRGLSQSDFPGIPPRTIGRIERGEVAKPRRATLMRIASELGVPVEELGTY